MSGSFLSAAAADVRYDEVGEDTLEIADEVGLRLRFPFTRRWTAIAEGRLGWRLTGSSGGLGVTEADGPTFVPRDETLQGSLRPELRDLYVAGRAGRWGFRIGQQSIVWGSTDISKPADVINPTDFRRGLSSSPSDARIPIPALDAILSAHPIALELVVVPFFVPHRAAVYGDDTALLPLPDVVTSALSALPLDRLVDPSLEELVQPLVVQSELPEELPRNASVGARVTGTHRGLDLSAGWFYGWDRFPYVRLSPALAAAAAILGGGATPDAESLQSVVQLVGDDLATGTPLVQAEYLRRHVVEVDAVRYLGPVGVRIESAFSPRRTLYRADLRSVRRASLLSAAGLSYERGDGNVVVSGEAFYQYVFREPGDGRFVLGTDRLLGFGLGGTLRGGVFGAFDTSRLADFGLTLGLVVFPAHWDVIASPALTFDTSDTLTLSVGATLATAAEPGGIGERVDADDAVFIKLEKRF